MADEEVEECEEVEGHLGVGLSMRKFVGGRMKHACTHFSVPIHPYMHARRIYIHIYVYVCVYIYMYTCICTYNSI